MKGCAYCIYCVDGLRDENDDVYTGCSAVPNKNPYFADYAVIDGIDYDKERMDFCPFNEPQKEPPKEGT